MQVYYVTYPSKVPWCSDFTFQAIKQHSSKSVQAADTGSVKKAKDSIVHFHNVQQLTLSLLWALRERGNTVIGGVKGRVGLSQHEAIIRELDCVVCNPDRALCDAVQRLNQRTFVVPEGEDPELFKPMNVEKRFVVSWVGREHKPFKHADLLARLGHSYEKATYESYWPHDRLPYFYNGSIVCVNFSDHEGFWRPGVEAAMCGIPVISTDVGVAREILDSEYLFDVPAEKHIGEYKTLVKAFSEDSGLAYEVGAANRLRAMKYAWAKVIPLYDRLWGSVGG